jgi:endonuclease/exonuclease/phosphatase family metal-dependent hydrolase
LLHVLALTASIACAACGQTGSRPPPDDDGGGASGNTGGAGGGGGGTGGEVEPQPLKILNWNVRNFFNDVDDSDDPDEPLPLSTSEWNEKRQAVAAVIAEMDPDVAILAEVENLAVLEDLAAEVGKGHEHLALFKGNDPRGIDIAAMSRLPFDSTVTHAAESFKLEGTSGPSFFYARDCLEAHVTFNGRRIALLGVHFKAKDNDDPDKRLAEAQHTRAIADALTGEDPELAVVILGDFNDLPASPPYQAVIGSPAFTNAALESPAPQWTFDYMGNLELVDHQIANPLLAGMLDASSAVIRHGADVDAASDHAPVMATYDVK